MVSLFRNSPSVESHLYHLLQDIFIFEGVNVPFKGNSVETVAAIRVDKDYDGIPDTTRLIVCIDSWSQRPSSINLYELSDRKNQALFILQFPGRIRKPMGLGIARLDIDGDGLADMSRIYVGSFDSHTETVYDLIDKENKARIVSFLNCLITEDEGPHGVALVRIDSDSDGYLDKTRVFYSGEKSHRVRVYDILDKKNKATMCAEFSQGDCVRTIATAYIDKDGDGKAETTRVFVNVISLSDNKFGQVKIYDIANNETIVKFITSLPGKNERPTGISVIRLDKDYDGSPDTCRIFIGNQDSNDVTIYDLPDKKMSAQLVNRINLPNSVLSVACCRLDKNKDGYPDTSRLYCGVMDKIIICDVEDDNGKETLVDVIGNHYMIYGITSTRLDLNCDGIPDKSILYVADCWGNKLSIYERDLSTGPRYMNASPPNLINPLPGDKVSLSNLNFKFNTIPNIWGSGQYSISENERLRRYNIQISKDKNFRDKIVDETFNSTINGSLNKSWTNFTYDRVRGHSLTAYTLNEVAIYSPPKGRFETNNLYWWRARGIEPVSNERYLDASWGEGWSGWTCPRSFFLL